MNNINDLDILKYEINNPTNNTRFRTFIANSSNEVSYISNYIQELYNLRCKLIDYKYDSNLLIRSNINSFFNEKEIYILANLNYASLYPNNITLMEVLNTYRDIMFYEYDKLIIFGMSNECFKEWSIKASDLNSYCNSYDFQFLLKK